MSDCFGVDKILFGFFVVTANVQIISQVGSTVADKYRLLRVLGIGGMGVVYEAQHAVTHRRVALKMMHVWVAESSPQAATRFLREAQAAASIGHPAIVDVLDAGQLPDGTLYLVFEMLDGVDLEAALAEGQLHTEDVVAIAIDVLEGLAAAHGRGFVHRDIKPANVFLAKNHAGERQVKLLDFGIAKRVDSASSFTGITAHGSIVGTLEYMSPEQASAESVDGRTDIWALGALLFRALAGRAPFIGASQLELVKSILCAPVPSLAVARPDLPRALTAIVERALTRDREHRWPGAAAMREALEALDRRALPVELPIEYQGSAFTPVRGAGEDDEECELLDFASNEPTCRAVLPVGASATGPRLTCVRKPKVASGAGGSIAGSSPAAAGVHERAASVRGPQAGGSHDAGALRERGASVRGPQAGGSHAAGAVRERGASVRGSHAAGAVRERGSSGRGLRESRDLGAVRVESAKSEAEATELVLVPIDGALISDSKIAAMARDDATQISHERDVATLLVREREQARPMISLLPQAEVIDQAPITRIVLEQSLLDDALGARSKSGRWTLASLAFCTALVASAWVLFADQLAGGEAVVVHVRTLEPAEDPPLTIPPLPARKTRREVAPAKIEAAEKDEPRAERREKRRTKARRIVKRVAPVSEEAKEAVVAEPEKKTGDAEFFYREDRL